MPRTKYIGAATRGAAPMAKDNLGLLDRTVKSFAEKPATMFRPVCSGQ